MEGAASLSFKEMQVPGIKTPNIPRTVIPFRISYHLLTVVLLRKLFQREQITYESNYSFFWCLHREIH
jgi:hypothetical protein